MKTIKIQEETAALLKKSGNMGDTYDSVIRKALFVYQKVKKRREKNDQQGI